MNVTLEDIEKYLLDVKTSIIGGSYRIDNNAKRQDNRDLFIDYVIDEAKAKEIHRIFLKSCKMNIRGMSMNGFMFLAKM